MISFVPGGAPGGGSEPLPDDELLRYRVLGVLGTLIILALGVAHRMVGTTPADPLWERLLVAGVTLAAAGLSFVYRRPGYRYVVYGVFYLVTLWIVHLLVLNDLAVEYALSIFIVVPAIGAMFRSPAALAGYLATTVLAVSLAAGLVTDPVPEELSRILYVTDVAVVCLLLYVIMSTRFRAERALLETERYYRSLIENADDAITVLDPDGTVTYASPASSRVFGYDARELVGRSAEPLVHPDDRDRLRTVLETVRVDSEAMVDARIRIEGGDGTIRHVDSEVRNLLDDPAVEGIVVNSRDVTERVELEQELRRSQKMEAVGRLAGGVAHDFNNLLGVISGQAELLRAELPAESSLRDDVEEILDASRRAADVTAQLLAVGKRQALDAVVFDLGDRIRDMRSVLENLTGEGVRLRVRVHGDPLPVEGDPAQIERVVVNLVANARDAMPEGGRVTVAAGPAGEGEGDRRCVLSVTDTGVGMSAEEQERIFEPFFTTKDEGTGLGLATVYGLVEQSGGAIEVESEPGRGTTFRIELPLIRDAG